MRPELYYHIIEIGVIFEKGRKSGDGWVKGEKEHSYIRRTIFILYSWWITWMKSNRKKGFYTIINTVM